jgi:hypothetical protein
MTTLADEDAPDRSGGAPLAAASEPPTAEAEGDEAVEGMPVLSAVLDRRFALGLPHVAVTTFFVLLFVLLNWLPLKPADLWGHVAYGRWIAAHRALPTEEPFVPLFAGMRVVHTAWLSQLLLAGAERLNGPEALSTLFAVSGVVTYLILARTYYLQTHRLGLAVLGVAGVIAIGLSRAITIRPEIFGSLCFAGLLWLVTSAGGGTAHGTSPPPSAAVRIRLWLGVPLLMALWANLHGSFLCGIAFLGCCFLGQVIEACWRGGRG